MQPINNSPNSGKVAFQQGLIFGLILAVIETLILLINTFVNSPSNQIGLDLILIGAGFLLGLAAYLVAGILATRKTGRVSTGTLAGLWTGTTYGAIVLVVSMVLFFSINLPRLLAIEAISHPEVDQNAYRIGAIAGGVGYAIFGILFAIGLGAGLGALGGLIGRGSFKASQPAYPIPEQPAPYQPYPYPLYPAEQYPPNPTQNAQNPPGQNAPYPIQPYPNQPYPPNQSNFERPYQ